MRIWPWVPGHLQGLAPLDCGPGILGHYGNAALDLQHPKHAWYGTRLCVIYLLQSTTQKWAAGNGRVTHTWQPDIQAKNSTSIDFGGSIHSWNSCPYQCELFSLF